MRRRKKRNNAVSDVVCRNIETLLQERRRLEEQKTLQERVSDAITDFSGSMAFVYVHAIWFAGWIVLNSAVSPFPPFDPYPYGFLTMVVSLEAIFLSTFVLISQNRMSDAADKRETLDLQVNLLAEHEVTRLLHMVDAIAEKLGVSRSQGIDVEELKKDVSPEAVLREIERREKEGRELEAAKKSAQK